LINKYPKTKTAVRCATHSCFLTKEISVFTTHTDTHNHSIHDKLYHKPQQSKNNYFMPAKFIRHDNRLLLQISMWTYSQKHNGCNHWRWGGGKKVCTYRFNLWSCFSSAKIKIEWGKCEHCLSLFLFFPPACACGLPLKRVTNESQPPESIQFAPYFLRQMCLFIKVNSPTQER